MIVIFGQIFAYAAFSDSHFSSPSSVSGLIALTGHSGSHTPAIDAFVGVNDKHVLALVEAVHRACFNAVHGFAANAALGDDVGQSSALSSSGSVIQDRRGLRIGGTALSVTAAFGFTGNDQRNHTASIDAPLLPPHALAGRGAPLHPFHGRRHWAIRFRSS